MDELLRFQKQWEACFHGENRLKYLMKAKGFFHHAEIVRIGACWQDCDATENLQGHDVSEAIIGKYMLIMKYNGTVYNLDFLEYFDEKCHPTKKAYKVFFDGFREDACSVNGRSIKSVLNYSDIEEKEFYEAIFCDLNVYEILKNTYENERNEYIHDIVLEKWRKHHESNRTLYQKVV